MTAFGKLDIKLPGRRLRGAVLLDFADEAVEFVIVEDARDGILLLEWPDRSGPLRPADALTVVLQSTGTESRRAVLSGWPDRIGRIA